MIYIFIYLKGMLMGIADLVPGVSGGTIALITGIYQRLINAISSVNLENIKILFSGQIKQAWQQIDGWFLVAVFIGMLSSIFLFAGLIKHLLANHAVLTWSFFFGLIIVSAILLLLTNPAKSALNWSFLLIGAALGYFLSTQSIGALPDGSIGIFIAGSIAICAMILPGISGSLILILLGKYQTLLAAVENREWMTLITFAGGCVVGLMIFSRILKWLLSHHQITTIYTLAGLMLGTLFKVWPWKINDVNTWPSQHPEPQWMMAGLMMLVAATAIWQLVRINERITS